MPKITDYAPLLLASVHTDDQLVIVDVHDTSMDPSGTTKNITLANLGVPFLNAANTFTGSPQKVGSAFTTGETDIFNGSINVAYTPDGSHVPFINFYSWAGGAAGNNGWQLGVDTHNHGGGKDFFIGKVVNGATTDLVKDQSGQQICDQAGCAPYPGSDSGRRPHGSHR